MKASIIGLWPALSRAVEIAIAGSHSVSLYFNKDLYPHFEDDYKLITRFYKNHFNSFVVNGDISIEIPRPRKINNVHYETLEDILNRVNDSKRLPTPPMIFDSPSKELLDLAYRRLGLSVTRFDKIKSIAATIARLDLSSSIEAHHIAEAIHYQAIDKDDIKDGVIVNPEQNSYEKEIAITTAYIYCEFAGKEFFSRIDKIYEAAKEFVEKYPSNTNWEGSNWETTLFEFAKEKSLTW